MAFTKCTICGKWDVGSHRCSPSFLVWCEEHGMEEADARTIYASDAEDAATQWAKADDCESADYLIVAQKSEPVVTVKDNRDGELKRFVVTGEAVPSYTATETT